MASRFCEFFYDVAALRKINLAAATDVAEFANISSFAEAAHQSLAFLQQWVDDSRAKGKSPHPSDHALLLAIANGPATVREHMVRLATQWSTVLSTRLENLVTLASSPKLCVSDLMAKPTKLTPAQIEEVKTLWRSDEAKQLLRDEAEYISLKTAFDDFLMKAGSKR